MLTRDLQNHMMGYIREHLKQRTFIGIITYCDNMVRI